MLLLTCNTPESPQTPAPALVQSIELSIPTPYLKADLKRATQYSIPLWLAQNIRRAATRNSIPLPIAFALVSAESDFTINALSWAGARGLSQVMPTTGMTHCSLSPAELYIPDLNLDCGFSYLSMMHSRYSDWYLALIAYNRGPARTNYELARSLGHGTSTRYATSIIQSSLLD